MVGAGMGMLISGSGIIVHLTGVGLIDEVTPLLATGNHPIDGAPVGETTDITVIDEEVCLQLAGEVGIVISGLLGVVAVGGIELHTAFSTPLECRIQELALTTGPKDQTVTVGNEHLQRLSGEGALLADLGVFILDDRAVKINCDNHTYFLMESSFLLP